MRALMRFAAMVAATVVAWMCVLPLVVVSFGAQMCKQGGSDEMQPVIDACEAGCDRVAKTLDRVAERLGIHLE